MITAVDAQELTEGRFLIPSIYLRGGLTRTEGVVMTGGLPVIEKKVTQSLEGGLNRLTV